MALVAGVDSSTQSTKVQIRDLHSGQQYTFILNEEL